MNQPILGRNNVVQRPEDRNLISADSSTSVFTTLGIVVES
jgi:hypothetical protein